MLEYWIANNGSYPNTTEFEIEEVLEDPSSATLFTGYPPSLLYFAAGCCVLFMLIGIPGNLITVAALFRTKKLRNATAVFIMNLSVSDLMFCCFNLPLATSTFWHSAWLHGQLLCRLFPLLRYGLVAVSLFTVLAITINRYVMIGHPRLYPKLYKPKYLALMVAATWTSGFGALIVTWFGQWGRFGLDPAIGSCSILPDVNGRSPKEFLFILAFVTPCLAIVVCYARIFYIVRRTALNSRRNKRASDQQLKGNLEARYTKNRHLQEDSAIGSSCGATLTTTENGHSPIKHADGTAVSSGHGIQNQRNSPKCQPHVARSSVLPRDDAQRRFPVDFDPRENFASSDTNDDEGTNRSRCTIVRFSNGDDDRGKDCRCKHSEASETSRYDNDTSVDSDSWKHPVSGTGNRFGEDIPYIDGGIGQLCDAESSGNDRSVDRGVTTVAKPHIRLEEMSRTVASPDEPCDGRILNQEGVDAFGTTKRPTPSDDNYNLRVPQKRYLQPTENSSDNSLCPRTIARYDEVSDDFVSSRSESPSEKRLHGKKSVLRRGESRFRSVKTRPFETGKMTAKDKKLLKMILVIFSSFMICYLPITITKTYIMDWRGLNIAGYILIYLTTCINPVIYVVMSSEYRSAYKNVLLCRSDSLSSRTGASRDRKKLKKPSE